MATKMLGAKYATDPTTVLRGLHNPKNAQVSDWHLAVDTRVS